MSRQTQKKYIRTSMQMNDLDANMKKYLNEHYVTVIDTWRAGAKVIIDRIQKSEGDGSGSENTDKGSRGDNVSEVRNVDY